MYLIAHRKPCTEASLVKSFAIQQYLYYIHPELSLACYVYIATTKLNLFMWLNQLHQLLNLFTFLRTMVFIGKHIQTKCSCVLLSMLICLSILQRYTNIFSSSSVAALMHKCVFKDVRDVLLRRRNHNI